MMKVVWGGGGRSMRSCEVHFLTLHQTSSLHSPLPKRRTHRPIHAGDSTEKTSAVRQPRYVPDAPQSPAHPRIESVERWSTDLDPPKQTVPNRRRECERIGG